MNPETAQNADELLAELGARYGASLAESLKTFCALDDQMPVQPALPVLSARSPESYWLRAEALLRFVRPRLGTLHGPLAAVLTLALIHQEENRTSSCFVAPLWVVGELCGLSRDRVEEILQEHREVLSHFCYRGAWATTYRPPGKRDAEEGTRWGGTLFMVPLPREPYEADVIFAPRVGGSLSFFSRRYRDLAHDVHCRFTELGWREKHPRARARYGASRDPGLPTGGRLALLEHLLADRFGHAAVHEAREREVRQLRTVHELLGVLEERPQFGKDGVGRWAREVAGGLAALLGDQSRTKVWLSVCWAAWRVSHSGLADGFSLLREGVFETLVRRADLAPKSRASCGATLNWVLNDLGLRKLDRQARRLALPFAA